MDYKKELELHHFREFRKLVSECPDSPACHRENPDFVLRTDTGFLGIEHTRFLQQEPRGYSPLAEQESLQDRVADSVSRLLVAGSFPPVWINLSFHPSVRLSKPGVEPLSQKIITFVSEHMPPHGDLVELEEEVTGSIVLPNGLMGVRISRQSCLTTPGCGTSRAGIAGAPDVSALQRQLDAKEAKIAKYREHCEEVWLLMVSDGRSLAASIDMEGFPSERVFFSSFDKVFLMHDATRVASLRTRARL